MLISICIPAYDRTAFLKRLLDSIVQQTFRDFEVIITDDTPGNAVAELAEKYAGLIPITYHKNQPALGTPENWNEGIRRASGEWIKLMHDDDWFAEAGSLQHFVDAATNNPGSTFFFSAYTNVVEETGAKEIVKIGSFRYRKLLENSASLFSSNVIGPPSVTMHRNDRQFWYDRKIKWVVDIDFYIRYFAEHRPVYIEKSLVNVGLNPQQVTKVSFRKPAVEIPENFYLLEKVGPAQLKDIFVYDAWWRLMRNLGVKDESQIRNEGYHGTVPSAVQNMIRMQKKIPSTVLKMGVFSKMFMLVSYIFNRPRIDS